jgi:hypothetical protein
MQSVNGLEEARSVVRDAWCVTRDKKVELISPPFAACHAGVGYYVALIEQLRAEFPNVDFIFTVCCGDDPAVAHDALRLGLKSIMFQGSPAMREKIEAIAQGLGAVVLTEYPQTI